jgi:hypothetical protein
MFFTKKQILILLILLFLGYPVYSKYPTYAKIEPILQETWDKQFPVPYRKILRKNVNGKGIMMFREAGKNYYIYTFHVAVPKQEWEDRDIKALKEERVLLVKLFHDPNDQEKPYFIRMGELDEEFMRPGFIRYVN